MLTYNYPYKPGMGLLPGQQCDLVKKCCRLPKTFCKQVSKGSLQAQRQLQQVKQQLTQSLSQSPRGARPGATPHRPDTSSRAASGSPPAQDFATPTPYSGSRDEDGSQTAPEGAEGSSEKKPFLRRRSRHVPVSQRQVYANACS